MEGPERVQKGAEAVMHSMLWPLIHPPLHVHRVLQHKALCQGSSATPHLLGHACRQWCNAHCSTKLYGRSLQWVTHRCLTGEVNAYRCAEMAHV